MVAFAVFFWAILPSPARANSCDPLNTDFDYSHYNSDLELIVEDLLSLPSGRVIVTGRYHDGKDTVHPVLLHTDDGVRWTSVLVPIAGADLAHLTSQDPDSVWGIARIRQEGLSYASYLLRSRDNGQSWCSRSIEDLRVLDEVEQLIFHDRSHGTLSFVETLSGTETTYETVDGGDSWSLLPRSTSDPPFLLLRLRNPGATFAYGRADGDGAPLTLVVRRTYHGDGFFAGSLTLSLFEGADSFVIDRKGFWWTSMAWARIPRWYRADGGRIEAR